MLSKNLRSIFFLILISLQAENLIFRNIPFSSISRRRKASDNKNQPTLISALIAGLNISIFPANTWREFPTN